MAIESYRYVVVGGGLAGASAVRGIREIDREGSIALFGAEQERPYHRPPLSKDLWFGRSKLDEIFVERDEFWNGVHVVSGTRVMSVSPRTHTIVDDTGRSFHFEKLVLATGGRPKRLGFPGGDRPGISYFRTLADYRHLRAIAERGRTAVVIGGGFIGSEIAAALANVGVDVTMIFPEAHLCAKVFPAELGRAIALAYEGRGVRILAGDLPVDVERRDDLFVTRTRGGARIASNIVVVGIGIVPDVELARDAGLALANGIIVDDRLRTSAPDIFAAGDNAFFPYHALNARRRVEHWDNALKQGRTAGRNMAGADEAYDYMPFFYSDLFDFGYEAVGDVDSSLEVVADWQEALRTGTLYYLRDSRVRGVMTCNMQGKMDAARELIRRVGTVAAPELPGLIHP